MVTFIFCAFFIRLFILQIGNGKNLQIKAVEQWVRSLPLKASRGKISDRNGNLLAVSYTTYDVYLRAKEVKDPIVTANFLAENLGLSFDSLYQKAKDVFISESLIKLNIQEDLALKIVKRGLSGVYVTENISRNYPYGQLASQVIGYLTSDSIGQSGVEAYYEKVLSGTNGKYLTQADVVGITLDDSLNYYVEAIDGLNLTLTIDANIQNIVERVLEKAYLEHSPQKVSAVVLNPNTSEILAMAINPSFDLNNVPRDNVEELMKLTKNTIVTDVFEPGSTFKIFTLASALQENLTNINETFYCPGYRIVDGEKIKCWKTTGHGSQTLIECVQNSCNCCFMDLCLRLGKDRMYSYLESYGIGKNSGVDILGESSGIMIDKNKVQTVDLARIAFGQSVATNELQLLNSICSVINGGTLRQPQVLKNYYDNNNKITYNNINLINGKSISEEVSNTMRYILEMSLSKTGEMTFVEGYKVAGKTGTAQKYGKDGKIEKGKYVSSFFGFLNNGDTPEYALLLCVDEPSNGTYYGSVVAKPYAKEIFEGIIAYKNIEKAKEDVVVEDIIVPSLSGKHITEALVILDKMNVNYEVAGEGEFVISQFPSAGVSVKKSSTLVINLE